MEKLPNSCLLAAFRREAQMMHTEGMRFSTLLPSTLTVLLGIGLVGCGEPPPNPQVPDVPSSIWVASEPETGFSLSDLDSEHFYDHPWPSDLRLENGRVKLTNFPNPRVSGNIISYIKYMDGVLDGFSPAAAGFVRFTGPFAPTILPTPEETLQPDAAVQLIDIDPTSPEYGKRSLVSLRFQTGEGG